MGDNPISDNKYIVSVSQVSTTEFQNKKKNRLYKLQPQTGTNEKTPTIQIFFLSLLLVKTNRHPKFVYKPFHEFILRVGFMVDKTTLGHVFPGVRQFTPVCIIPRMLHALPFIHVSPTL